MVDSIRKSKVLDVRGFELLRFDAEDGGGRSLAGGSHEIWRKAGR